MKKIFALCLIILGILNIAFLVHSQESNDGTVYSGDGNYTVGVTVDIARRNGDTAGIVFRNQNDILYDTAYYMAVITNVQNNVVFKLRKRIRYDYYDIYSKDMESVGVHDISVSAVKNKITVFLDGAEEYTFEDYGYLDESYIGHPLLAGGAEPYVSTADGNTSYHDFYIVPSANDTGSIISEVHMYDDSGNEIENFVPPDSKNITVDAVLKEPVNADMIFGMYTADGYVGAGVAAVRDESFVSAGMPVPSNQEFAYMKIYTWTEVSKLKPVFNAERIGEINNYIRKEKSIEKIAEPDFSESVFAFSNCELSVAVGDGSNDSVSGIAIDTGLAKNERLYGKDLYICAIKNGILYMYHDYEGKREKVAEAALHGSEDGEYNMTVKFRGADIRVSIDGAFYASYTARNLFYINGMVGRYTDGEGAFVRNLKIK